MGDKKWQNTCRHLPEVLEKILVARGGLEGTFRDLVVGGQKVAKRVPTSTGAPGKNSCS